MVASQPYKPWVQRSGEGLADRSCSEREEGSRIRSSEVSRYREIRVLLEPGSREYRVPSRTHHGGRAPELAKTTPESCGELTNDQPKLNELHGGEVEWAVSEKYNIPISQIVSFASTVSPIIPKSIVSLVRKLDRLYLYPARDHTKLKEAIAKHQGVDETGEIILGCGSTEIIHIFAQMIAGSEAIIPAPTYGEYETAVTKYGGKPVFVGIGEDFNLDIEAIEEVLSPRTKAIFVCNPNNPTGRLYERSDLLELARIARERELVLMVDEAYLAFAPEAKKYSMTSLIGSYPVLVLN